MAYLAQYKIFIFKSKAKNIHSAHKTKASCYKRIFPTREISSYSHISVLSGYRAFFCLLFDSKGISAGQKPQYHLTIFYSDILYPFAFL